MGVGNRAIMWRHILPNSLTPVLAFLPFRISGAVLAMTSLDFLGLGVPASQASLGELLAQGTSHRPGPGVGAGRLRRRKAPQCLLLGVTVFVRQWLGVGSRCLVSGRHPDGPDRAAHHGARGAIGQRRHCRRLVDRSQGCRER